MGFAIRLEDEFGSVLDQVLDPKNTIPRRLPEPADEEFRCVCFIDRYGDTVFNRLQIPDFLAEWERLRKDADLDDAAGTVHIGVVGLAERCLAGVHLYLKFYGD